MARTWIVAVWGEKSLYNQEKEIIAWDLLYNFKCLSTLKCLFKENLNLTKQCWLHISSKPALVWFVHTCGDSHICQFVIWNHVYLPCRNPYLNLKEVVKHWLSHLESRNKRQDLGSEFLRVLYFAFGRWWRHTKVTARPSQYSSKGTVAYVPLVEIKMGNRFRKQGGFFNMIN